MDLQKDLAPGLLSQEDLMNVPEFNPEAAKAETLTILTEYIDSNRRFLDGWNRMFPRNRVLNFLARRLDTLGDHLGVNFRGRIRKQEIKEAREALEQLESGEGLKAARILTSFALDEISGAFYEQERIDFPRDLGESLPSLPSNRKAVRDEHIKEASRLIGIAEGIGSLKPK